MADIHIGMIRPSETGRGRAQLVYHIPVETPVAGVVPTPTSTIAGELQQAEIDALAAGTLVEITKDIVVSDSQNQSEVATAVRADWQNVKANYNGQYDFEHKFYGVTLDATA
ncbi:MAG: hypothetical protein AMJ75_04340 [Phycisphaerae bacterium SM1_79]|nr:MAG: hypothetical protein AMJ75_04340 [Phycisphaerae bacterium SM1_79]